MARPKNADSSKTHDRIVAGARRLLEDDGPSAISYRSVAQRAGVGVGTVRYYFASIDQLNDAVLATFHERLEHVAARWLQRLRESSPEGIPDLIEASVRALYRLARGNHATVSLRLRTHTPSRFRVLRSIITQGAPVLARVCSRDRREVRLNLHAIILLGSRWATMSRQERHLITGVEDDARSEAILESHLSGLARRLLTAR